MEFFLFCMGMLGLWAIIRSVSDRSRLESLQQELRTLQDWFVRYQLTKAHGVSEVASLGGFVQQYQVVVDPHKLQAWRIVKAKHAATASNVALVLAVVQKLYARGTDPCQRQTLMSPATAVQLRAFAPSRRGQSSTVSQQNTSNRSG